jgi:NodT family efflux transporter outer membrane factor (OMF) lipoprotein
MSNFRKYNGKWRLALLAIAVIAITGCATVGPEYEAPQMEMSAEWNTDIDPALLPKAELVRQWWTLFNDPLLNRLIESASENNLDLLSAIARVGEHRARLGIAESDQYLTADVTAGVTRQMTSENSTGDGQENSIYSSGINLGWEIDLFGRVRRSIEAASADYQISEEDRTDVMISLYSHVALTYIEIRTNQARLTTAQANIESFNSVLTLTQSRFKHGLASGLDVAQAESLLARAEAEIPSLRTAVTQGINNLHVLLGLKPGSINGELKTPQLIPLPPAKAAVGVPADLLRQRPDIRKAERQLAAQTARIGVVTADLYPSFSLSGSLGYESLDAGNLVNPGSQMYSVGPSLRWNIFSRGRIRNHINAQDAITRQALFAYEQTVLNGLSEVENALKAYTEDRLRLDALERSVEAVHRSVKLSTNLYKQGLVDFQPVIDAQRNKLDSENQLASAKGESAANFIRLYTALGGGWDPKQPASVVRKTADQGKSLHVENKGGTK